MKFCHLIPCLFLLLCSHLQAQQINFAVEMDGKTQGYAEVWIDQTADQQIYAFQMGEIQDFPIGVSHITSMYQEGKLLSSSSTMGNNHINIQGDGQYYHSMCQGTYEPFKSAWVQTGLAKLFCERPQGKQVLIEAEGEVKPIARVGANSYEILLNNGAEVTFSYKMDDCVAVNISRDGVEWKLTRVDGLTL